MKVELSNVTKRFGHVLANDAVDLAFFGGEVLALLGENGAGKSTLMKILYGVERADSGEVRIDGARVDVSSPSRAGALGIGMVFQHFSLIPALTVRENLILGARDVPLFYPLRGDVLDRALAELQELAPELDPGRRAGDLSVAEQQLVELAKVLSRGAKIVILDEPTSVLTRLEAMKLTGRLRALAAQGRAVVLITHKLEDVRECADRVVVMRAGRVSHETRAVTDTSALLRAMLAAEPAVARAPSVRRFEGVRLELSNVSARTASSALHDVSLSVHAGEVLGVAGVTGNGQELLGRVLSGVVRPSRGAVLLDGEELRPGPAGTGRIAYVPEQPLTNGAARGLSVLVNSFALEVTRLPWWLDLTSQRRRGRALLERFDVRPRDLDRRAETLSGGNVQKLVIARELSAEAALVVACFPTMGLDAAARRAVVAELLAAADRGAAVVWISEEVECLLENADRIAVLHRGKLVGPVSSSDCSMERLGSWMTGAAA